MPEWWLRLVGKMRPPQVPKPPERSDIDDLRTGLVARERRETTLTFELRRIERELRRRGQ